jgi:hypothetical protein
LRALGCFFLLLRFSCPWPEALARAVIPSATALMAYMTLLSGSRNA